MDKREHKDRIYSEISRIAKAISNPNRLEILDFIANAEKSVEDIALQTGISIANASQHLQTLKAERLVTSSKHGNRVFYTLESMDVYMAWKSLRNLALSVSPSMELSMAEFRASLGYQEACSLDEVKDRADVCLLDVRPVDEYEKAHIPNAVSIPIKELTKRLKELPKDKLVVAYCRGMFCTYADEAVKILLDNGYNAAKIDEGVLDYELAVKYAKG